MTGPALAISAQLATELSKPVETTAVRVRASHLKAMARSPHHARWAMQHDWEPTLAMRLGRGAHSLLLGGPPVLCNPFPSSRSKAYESWRAQQRPDAIVLSRKVYDKANRINEAVRSNTLACNVLFCPDTVYERTIEFDLLGRACRATPDARTVNHVVELKTTRDASPDRFHWDVARMGYAEQLAMYGAAMTSESGLAPRRHYIVAVESNPPHDVTVHLLTQGTIDRARRRVEQWMTELLECERTGNWPGLSSTVLDLDIPDQNMELVFDDEQSESEGDE